jgi:hypothetical protein
MLRQCPITALIGGSPRSACLGKQASLRVLPRGRLLFVAGPKKQGVHQLGFSSSRQRRVPSNSQVCMLVHRCQ